MHSSRIEEVLEQAGDLSGKVVLTCSLPMNADNTAPFALLVGELAYAGKEGPELA